MAVTLYPRANVLNFNHIEYNRFPCPVRIMCSYIIRSLLPKEKLEKIQNVNEEELNQINLFAIYYSIKTFAI